MDLRGQTPDTVLLTTMFNIGLIYYDWKRGQEWGHKSEHDLKHDNREKRIWVIRV